MDDKDTEKTANSSRVVAVLHEQHGDEGDIGAPVAELVYRDGDGFAYGDEAEAVSVEQFADYIEKHSLPSEAIDMELMGGGLVRFMFHPERIENAEYGGITNKTPVRVFLDGTAYMRADIPYFAIYNEGDTVSEATLFACDAAAVVGGETVTKTPGATIDAQHMTLEWTAAGESEKHEATADDGADFIEHLPDGTEIHRTAADYGLDVGNLYAFVNADTGKSLTFMDAAFALLTTQTALGFALEYEQRREEDARRPRISATTLEEVVTTTDKLNKTVWNRFANLAPGQLALGFAEDGSATIGIEMASGSDLENGKSRALIYAINFDGLEEAGIVPHLKPYDRRVYEALSSLWQHVTAETEQDVFGLKDIYFAMGYKGNPGAADKRKINDSITKMLNAHISIDNLAEADAYRYPRFRYDASLLPCERITGYVDGQVVDGLIHLFREPPLFTFARERRQLTSHSINVLQSPLSKTDTNIQIEDYLREQIAWMKNEKGKKRSNKITLASIFEAAGITRRDARKRKRADIVTLLDHYTECEWIAGFKDTGDGFEIYF